MQIQKLILQKVARCIIKVAQYSTKVAPYSIKVGIKIFLSKHAHAGSSFKDLVARVPAVKTDLNSDARFERYDFLKFKTLK